ncbi:hypothetical protein PX701_12130 [Agromyces sp. H3Y2-19a]|jgi:hypothetical protein|uniref:hypothetical protein n=1 Tax=Agromyces TaxID=33877 RepID=UPI001E648E76|nr:MULTISPECIES: hypothetical protein [Agromyces]MCD5348028.1 hypothetical protein [Agromyces sp. S2-1-8]MDF0514372.1 hypothetical protein [Agromyces chromiiresistens]
MEAPSSTTLVVVGDETASAIHALERFANVRAASLPDASDAEVARWSSGSDAPYVVHDHDPLAHVAAAWVEFFDDLSTYGVLELEIARALEAAGRHDLSVPDYYVVIHPENLPVTWKHWWLGVLASASPSRVIPWPDADASLAQLLRRLPAARAWPEVGTWLPTVAAAVPDRVGLG